MIRFRSSLALAHAKSALDIFKNERDFSTGPQVLLTLQGHTSSETTHWTGAVQRYLQHFEGIAWGGKLRHDLRHVLRTLLRLDRDGLLQRVQRIHFLGTCKLGFTLCLTALQRALSEHLGRDVTVAFDTATPFLLGQKYQRAIVGPNWGPKALTMQIIQLKRGSSLAGDNVPFPFTSAIGEHLRMCDLRRKRDPYDGWDELGRLLLCHHNVEAISRTIIQANQIADIQDSTAGLIPPGIMRAREVIRNIFKYPDPDAEIRHASKFLGMFVADGTEKDDRE
jgi:hypothetical protein